MSSESSSRSVDAQKVPAKPFQFTLRQALLWMAGSSVVLALIVQLGIFAIPVLWFAAVVGLIVGSSFKQSYEMGASAMTLLILGLCLGLPMLDDGRGPSPRSTCSNNLKQILLGLQNYHDTFGTFPPAYIPDAEGRPMHSWRVLILPFMEQGNLYALYRFDEPWNGPNNSKLAVHFPSFYRCPKDYDDAQRFETSYVAVLGEGTAWSDNQPLKPSDFADGCGSTLMVVEVHESGINWMEPRDLHVTQMPMAVNAVRGQGISSAHLTAGAERPSGANVGYADGSVRYFSTEMSPEALRAALTRAGGEQIELP